MPKKPTANLYSDTVDLTRMSIFTGGEEIKETASLAKLLECGIPMLVEFAKDDDIQYIKICSTNIGMMREYQKRYASKKS